MQPKIELLSNDLISRILDEALQLLSNLGVKVQSPPARRLLAEAGAQGEENNQGAQILQQYAAQSTAVVCNDAPKEIGDLYRLYIVLLHSGKPIVTGAFSTQTTHGLVDMLAIFAGGRGALGERPLSV